MPNLHALSVLPHKINQMWKFEGDMQESKKYNLGITPEPDLKVIESRHCGPGIKRSSVPKHQEASNH